jgi:hypothetical protein
MNYPPDQDPDQDPGQARGGSTPAASPFDASGRLVGGRRRRGTTGPLPVGRTASGSIPLGWAPSGPIPLGRGVDNSGALTFTGGIGRGRRRKPPPALRFDPVVKGADWLASADGPSRRQQTNYNGPASVGSSRCG